jgi:hypothetical protein
MPLVEGTLLEKFKDSAGVSTIAADCPFFVQGFLRTYVHMVRKGFIHMDMHPGNMMVTPCRTIIVAIDWGEVVDVPPEHQEDVQALFKYIVMRKGMDTTSDTLPQLCQRLGVKSKPGTTINDDNYENLTFMLDICFALKGDSEASTNAMVKSNVFEAPGWFEAWQKATNAVVTSLQAAGATVADVETMLKSAVQEGLPSHTGSGRDHSRSPRRNM